jgi:vacuolar-type H+-ATPase subunit C/Vma6
MWDDLNARSRGLGTHFLTRSQLDALAREPDLPALAEALRRHGILVAELAGPARPGQIELGIRRWAARSLRTLGRWAGARAVALPFIFDDEDRRSVRAMLRGAVQRAPAERRLAGLIPTPALPERALEELGRSPTPAAAAGLLAAWRHPLAAPLAPLVAAAQPDLFALDLALARACVDRATQAARVARDESLREVVRETVDLENGVAAVVLAMEGKDVVPKDTFLPNGRRLSIVAFEEAIAARDPGGASARIAVALSGTPYADAFRRGARDPVTLTDELLRRRLRAIARRVRMAPLGPLAVLWFGLRLRAQVVDLQRVVWTVALGAPRQRVIESLATAAT